MKVIDIEGQRFGRLIVASRGPNNSKGQSQWKCLCDCGQVTLVSGSRLRAGKSKSCGCYRAIAMSQTMGTHRKINTITYARWTSMKRRCVDPAKAAYYRDRGIRVCERWKESFEAFLADAGECPSAQHSLDRINNDGHYEPGNVRWATMREQCGNRRKPQRQIV